MRTKGRRLLEAKMALKGLNQSDIAQIIGLHPCSVSQKLGGKQCFTTDDIQAIRKALRLSNKEVIDIFFGDSVANCNANDGDGKSSSETTLASP